MSTLLKNIEYIYSDYFKEIYELLYKVIDENNLELKVNKHGILTKKSELKLPFLINSFNNDKLSYNNYLTLLIKNGKLTCINSSNLDNSIFSEVEFKFYEDINKKLFLQLYSFNYEKKISDTALLKYRFNEEIYCVHNEIDGHFFSTIYYHNPSEKFYSNVNPTLLTSEYNFNLSGLFNALLKFEFKDEVVLDFLFGNKTLSKEEKDFLIISHDINIDDFHYPKINFLTTNNKLNNKIKI